MKTMIKYFNCFGFVLALCVMIFSGCSCSTPKPDPLAGFHASSLGNLDNNKAITDDYKDYIQKEKLQEYMPMVFFYENETAQHAVEIKFGINGANWHHVLIYDKDNKRIKTIKYVSGHSAS